MSILGEEEICSALLRQDRVPHLTDVLLSWKYSEPLE